MHQKLNFSYFTKRRKKMVFNFYVRTNRKDVVKPAVTSQYSIMRDSERATIFKIQKF